MKNPMIEIPIPTAQGTFLARYGKNGLAGLDFPTGRNKTVAPAPNPAPPAPVARWQRATESALQSVLRGRAPRRLPPLDWSGKSEFQQAVWRQLRRIPPGQTKSYGDIARAMGKPAAVRAVGRACGANPIPVLVPCHRVLAASGKIGGFSGGLDWKRRLLSGEGIALSTPMVKGRNASRPSAG